MLQVVALALGGSGVSVSSRHVEVMQVDVVAPGTRDHLVIGILKVKQLVLEPRVSESEDIVQTHTGKSNGGHGLWFLLHTGTEKDT